jgi:recombination protein RecA
MKKEPTAPKAGGFNFSSIIGDIKETLKKDKRDLEGAKIGVANELNPISKNPNDYVIMPEWFDYAYGVPGLPFGKIVQIAGDSDTGKTSLCIAAMKAAQAQGHGIIYVETEGKTSKEDLEAWGVDPNGVLIIETNITEEAFDLSFRSITAFFKSYPEAKILFVFDSFGNTISLRDAELDITQEHQKVGGASKTNRLGLGRLIALMAQHPIACLLVNYTYDNIGSVGKVEAGGKGLKFYTMIGIHSQRTGDWVRDSNKVKVKAGTFVRWSTFKNHFQKSAVDSEGAPRTLPKSMDFKISAKGIEVSDKKED